MLPWPMAGVSTVAPAASTVRDAAPSGVPWLAVDIRSQVYPPMTCRMLLGRAAPAILAIIAVAVPAAIVVAEEPSPSPEASWPTGAQLATRLESIGYRFETPEATSPWPSGGYLDGDRPAVVDATPGGAGSVHIDGPADAPATVRLAVAADARLTEVDDIGAALGVGPDTLSQVVEAISAATNGGSCDVMGWPVAGGRVVLWDGASLGGDVEVDFVSSSAGDGSGTVAGIPSPDSGVCQAPAATTTTLELKAGDLWFKPDKLSAPAGTVVIDFQNTGRIVHNLTFDDPAASVVESPGHSGELVLEDLAPGTYTFYCSVSGHRQAGMEGTLTITG
jgi:uncharacterized cupredoxin-like copper-binding protein